MRKFALGILMSLGTFGAWGCSLELVTDSWIELFDGSACVQLSPVINGVRTMSIDVHSSAGLPDKHENRVMRAGRVPQVLATYNMPLLGEMNLVEMTSPTLNRAVLKFYNGNSIVVQVDESGRVTPSRICVAQEGASTLRGYVNRCP